MKESHRSREQVEDSLLLLTLLMEAAYIQADWTRFHMLAAKRSNEIKARASVSGQPSSPTLRQIANIDRRMIKSMSERKRKIAQELGRKADFRKSSSRFLRSWAQTN